MSTLNDPTGVVAGEPHTHLNLAALPQRVPGATLGQDAEREAREQREGDR